MNPAFTCIGIFLLPKIGFNNINPDILINISENRVICAVVSNSISLSLLQSSSLYHLKDPYCKILKRLQHVPARKHQNDPDHKQLGNKRDRLFMDLGCRLYNGD